MIGVPWPLDLGSRREAEARNSRQHGGSPLQKLRLFRVDAFTHRPLEGNPCAVVLNADGLTTPEMQAVAREMNLSETAFVLESSVADHRARYFTPAEEIPLAGHPTIATTVALMDSGRLEVGSSPMRFSLELQAGVVEIRVDGTDHSPPIVTMTQLKPGFHSTYGRAEVAQLFGLEAGDLLEDAPLQTVSTGTPMLMVPVRSLEALRRVDPDLQALKRLRDAGDFFSVHLFCLRGLTEAGNTFARHIGIPPDLMEDPFTGSATGCMGAYLWRYELIRAGRFVAEQGHWMGRPGRAWVEVVGAPDDIQAVLVGGQGITVMTGELTIGTPP